MCVSRTEARKQRVGLRGICSMALYFVGLVIPRDTSLFDVGRGTVKNEVKCRDGGAPPLRFQGKNNRVLPPVEDHGDGPEERESPWYCSSDR